MKEPLQDLFQLELDKYNSVPPIFYITAICSIHQINESLVKKYLGN